MRIDVYHHSSGEAEALSRIENLLVNLLARNIKMDQAVTDLQASATRVEGLVSTVSVELNELKVALDDAINAGSLEAMRAVSARLNAAADALASAAKAVDITPETPVEQPPVVTP